MKKTLFTLLILSTVVGIMSCRKSGSMPNIKQYDDQQIQSYISANGITGMKRDTVGGDTTGIYYQIIQQGTGAQFDYPDSLFFTYTLKSFDGLYNNTDTVTDHFDGLLGHTAPKGLTTALHDVVKYKGTKVRLLIPSHLAYGLAGAGSGSKTIVNGRIAGNQCLDYTIYVVPDLVAYDDQVIQNYIAANSLSGYTKLLSGPAAGMYYKITVPPVNGNLITYNSSVTLYYTGQLMDNSFFDETYAPTVIPPATTTTATTFTDLQQITPGFRTGLFLLGSGNGSISLLIPSRLAYGNTSSSGSTTTIPANSCLRFEVQVTTVVTN